MIYHAYHDELVIQVERCNRKMVKSVACHIHIHIFTWARVRDSSAAIATYDNRAYK